MIDERTGVLKIGENLIFSPQFTYKDFMKTPYYNGQDGVRMIYLKDKQIIDEKSYIVSFFFRDEKIYMVSLINCDEDIAEKDEQGRKKVHDNILQNSCIENGKEYTWGKVESNYDARSNISSIDILYK